MSSTYIKDLTLEIDYKLSSTSIYKACKVNKEWSNLLTNKFWLTKFIRDFGSSLPNGVDYGREYLDIEKMTLYYLYLHVISNNYIKLLIVMLAKWKPEEELLPIAAKYGKLEIIKYLLANGADIHAQYDSALRNAAYYGHLEVVKFLIANGAVIHAQADSALIWAAHNGHLEVVKLLLFNGANIHAQEDYALRWGAQNGRLELVKFLLDNGASIKALTNNWYTNKELKSLVEEYKKK